MFTKYKNNIDLNDKVNNWLFDNFPCFSRTISQIADFVLSPFRLLDVVSSIFCIQMLVNQSC